MNDMASVIVPKSDQINADTLIAGPVTITIERVEIKGGAEQPVEIFPADGGLPWRPCKSMSKVLVAAWGADAKAYTGRSVTLFRDPTVKWGGLEVGGIRISHMTDISAPMTMALTATRGNKKAFTVKVLEKAKAKPEPKTTLYPNPERIAWFIEQLGLPETLETLTSMYSGFWPEVKILDAADRKAVDEAKDKRKGELAGEG